MLKYLTVFFLSITLSGGALAKPQPKQHPPESAAATERPKDDKKGTKDAPLEVNARAVQTDKEAAEEASKDAEQKRVNRWNIGLTSAIAVCAGLQVFGIAAQVFVYLKQTALMKDTLDAIKEQARLMGEQLTDARKSSTDSAKANADTLQAIKRQADALDAQNRISQSRERARLIVIDPPESPSFLPWEGVVIPNAVPLQLFVDVVNNGPTRAFNVSAKGTMKVRSSVEMLTYSEGEDLNIVETVGEATAENPIRVFVTGGGIGDFTMIQNSVVNQIQTEQAFLAISGKISFEDIFGTEHATPFHFVWTVFGNDDGRLWRDDSFWENRSPKST